MLIGIDLDNTIVRYDNSLHKIALERELIGKNTPIIKRVIRDEVRELYGDEEWQKLQIAIYGDSIGEAELMPGVCDFLLSLKYEGHFFNIVSHKTKYPNFGNCKVDLRKSALKFLAENDFFSDKGLSMESNDIFFLSTRKEKADKIKELGCDIFIDDLEEVFTDPSFPSGVIKVLFSPDNERRSFSDGRVFSSFQQISDYTFGLLENDK